MRTILFFFTGYWIMSPFAVFQVSSVRLSIVVALEAKGKRKVQLFDQNTGGFLFYYWNAKSVTLTRHPVTSSSSARYDWTLDTSNLFSIQPIGKKKYERGYSNTDSDWPESAGDKVASEQGKLESGKWLRS
jgi:hypothetical protein